jgi:hypothetical protein
VTPVRSAWVVLTVVSFAEHASAQIPLAVEDCAEEADIRAAFEVELADADASILEAIDDNDATIVCGPDAAEIRLVHRATGRFVGQSIERTAEGFARRIAIATAELLRAPAAVPALPATPVREVRAPDRNPTQASEPVVLSLGGSGVGSWVGGEPTVLGGVAVRGTFEPASVLALALDLEALFGSFTSALGSVGAFIATASLSSRFGGVVGPFALRTGPLIRGGVSAFRGQPADATIARGDTLVGPWLGLGAVGEIAVRAAQFEVYLEIEAGVVPLATAARVDGAIASDLTGVYLEARLGVAWRSR